MIARIKALSLCIFYVYALFDAYGIVRYIGKGKGNRWLNHEKVDKRNWRKYEFITNTLKSLGEIPKVKIRENLTELEAFEIETALIVAIGRMDLGTGPLVNWTDGGDGMSGHKHSAETLAIMSEMRKRHNQRLTPEQRSEIARKGAAKMTPEQILNRMLKSQAALTPEQRRLNGIKAQAQFTPEERSERTRRAFQNLTPEERRLNGIRAQAQFTPEERSLRAKRASARMDPEKRRELGRIWASKQTHEQRVAAGKAAAAVITHEQRVMIGYKAAATYKARGGIRNWCDDSRWITDGTKTLRLKPGEPLPNGWSYGRRLKKHNPT